MYKFYTFNKRLFINKNPLGRRSRRHIGGDSRERKDTIVFTRDSSKGAWKGKYLRMKLLPTGKHLHYR